MKSIFTFLKYSIVTLGVLFVVPIGYRYLTDTIHETTLTHPIAIYFSDVYAHHGDFIKDTPFHPGEYFFVHYKIERRKTCLVTIQFRLTKLRPGDLYTGSASYSYPPQIYYGPPASLETNEYFVIPLGMPTGQYELRRINLIDCESAKWAEVAPPAPLTIE
jgi:hypothetical protein